MSRTEVANNLAFTAFTQLAKVSNMRNHFQIQWYNEWHPKLDEALQCIPEMESYPHELFRLLINNQNPQQSKIALFIEHETPKAIVALRRYGFSWELVTQWILPGACFPVENGYLLPALISLGVDTKIAWWRMEAPPPSHPWVRDLEMTPTYGLKCSQDFEEHWRTTGHLKNVRKTRNRCKKFTLKVNAPGMAEWTIREWASKWWGNFSSEMPEYKDRLTVANYLMSIGRYYSLSLWDEEQPIAGATLNVQNNDLVAGVIYRKSSYDNYGIGTRLLDLTFEWAAQTNYTYYDLGGGQDYKMRWAPQHGSRYQFDVCPSSLYNAKQALRRLKSLVSR